METSKLCLESIFNFFKSLELNLRLKILKNHLFSFKIKCRNSPFVVGPYIIKDSESWVQNLHFGYFRIFFPGYKTQATPIFTTKEKKTKLGN